MYKVLLKGEEGGKSEEKVCVCVGGAAFDLLSPLCCRNWIGPLYCLTLASMNHSEVGKSHTHTHTHTHSYIQLSPSEHVEDIAPVISHNGYYAISMVLLGLLVLALLGVAGFAYYKKEKGGKRYF